MRLSSLRRAPAIIALAIGAALLLCGLLAAVERAFLNYLNSDLLYIAAFYRDLTTVGVSQWNLPPAPYFFPDMAVFFSILRTGADLGRAYLGYGVLQFLLAVAGWGAVFAAIDGSLLACGTAALSAGLLFVACTQSSHVALGVAFLPIFHAGTLTAGTWFLAATLWLVRRGAKRLALGALFLLAFLTGASDLFFVLQIVAPLCVALLIAARLGQVDRSILRTWLLVVGAAGIAVVGLFAILARTAEFEFGSNPILSNLHHIASVRGLVCIVALVVLARAVRKCSFRSLVNAGAGLAFAALVVALIEWHRLRPLLGVPNGWPKSNLIRFMADLYGLARTDPQVWIWACVAPWTALWMIRRALRAKHPALLVGSLFVVFSATASVVIPALYWNKVGNIVFPAWEEHRVFDVGVIRHMQPAWVWPIFIVALSVLAARRVLPRGAIGASLMFVTIVGAACIVPRSGRLSASDFGRLPYPSYARCLDAVVDRERLHAGLGDYWTSRHLTMLSRRAIVINQLKLDTLAPERWVNNRRRFVEDERGAYPTYDFLVVGAFERKRLLELFGAPASERQCHGVALLVYNRPGDQRFRDYVRSGAGGRPAY